MKKFILFSRLFILVTVLPALIKSIELNCYFVSYKSDGYNCKVESFRITDKSTSITSVKGNHLTGKNNSMVDVLYIPDSNCMKYLPIRINDFFMNLKKLDITDGALHSFTRNNFIGLISMETIDIKNSLLSEISEDAFLDLENLQNLTLSNNKIQSLHSKIFIKLMNLKKINLSGNLLEVLPFGIFQKNTKLEEINFSDNRLRTIDSTILMELKELSYARFDGNFCIDQSYPTDLLFDELMDEMNEKCNGNSKLVSKSILRNFTIQLQEYREALSSSEALIRVADERSHDLQFNLNVAYKTISNLKETFDLLQTNCTNIEENVKEIYEIKIQKIIELHNETNDSNFITQSRLKELMMTQNSTKIMFIITTAILLILVIILVIFLFLVKAHNTERSVEFKVKFENEGRE